MKEVVVRRAEQDVLLKTRSSKVCKTCQLYQGLIAIAHGEHERLGAGGGLSG